MSAKTIFIAIAVLIILVAAAIFFIPNLIEKQKHFSGIKIIFFAGGNEDSTFARVVYNGAKAAEEDLGPTVKYVWSGWNTEKMALQFKEAIDESPDAICIMGHPGEEVLGPLVDEAERKGIIVTAQNIDIPNVRKKYIDNGFGYVGQEVYSSGLILARGSIKKFGLKAGDSALIFGRGLTAIGSVSGSSVGGVVNSRTQGCIDGLNESGIKVHAEEIANAVHENPYSEDSAKFVEETLKKYPDVKLIITDHGELTGAIGGILEKMGKKPGEIFVAGFDLSKNSVAAIKKGYLGLLHDQQPYLQGYLPILQACLTKKYGFAGMYIDTGIGLVDSSNIDIVEDLAAKMIR
jgi:simple sugar transport system substrate-binding protein